jgi:hypothetical protein
MPSAVTTATSSEDDAFYHPVGRMRSLADVTLDGYRPEPTLLVRAATRRKRILWVLPAVLLPLVVLAAIAIFASAGSPSESFSTSGFSNASPALPAVALRGKTPLQTTSAVSKPVHVTSAPIEVAAPSTASTTPVFDVNSLPSAKRGR